MKRMTDEELRHWLIHYHGCGGYKVRIAVGLVLLIVIVSVTLLLLHNRIW
jgi:hypothetical protein